MTVEPCEVAPRARRPNWLTLGLGLASVTLLLQLLPYPLRYWRELPRAGHQTPGRTTVIDDQGISTELHYYVYLPVSYDRSSRWPLLLYLHGGGERGTDVRQLLGGDGVTGRIAGGEHFPLIVASPQCRPRRPWQPGQLLMFLEHLERQFAIDRDRVYVAGYSMGGSGTWDLAAAAPERFAAIVPAAGHTEASYAERLARMPIWAFHGRQDSSATLRETTRTIEGIRQLGGNPKFTVYEDAGHDIEQITFARGEIFRWLLERRRASSESMSR